MKKTIKISNYGYKKNSPDKNEESLIIPNNRITMVGVDHQVLGIDNLGNQILMDPGVDNYQFPGDFVMEYPMMQNGGNMKKPNNEGFYALPEKVQNMILRNMQTGGENNFDSILYAQSGVEVKTPKQLNVVRSPAKPENVAQNIAAQYNLDDLPSITERNTWNKYLDWVENRGYKTDSDSLLSLNAGKNRFPELSSEYNTQMTNKNKEDYVTAKTRPNFDKNITEDQFIQARSVNPQMMINAQKVYGQQTKKDNWFGSETARTFYPKIKELGVSYGDMSNASVQAKVKEATGKLAPVEVYDYKTNQLVPFRGVTTIKGYDAKGNPQYDNNNIKSYQSNMSSSIYYDPTAMSASANAAYQRFINTNVTPTEQRKHGGDIRLDKFMTNYCKQFGGANGNEQIQGQSIDQFLQKNNNEFVNYLSNNVQNVLYKDEYMNFQNLPKAQMGSQVNLDNPENPLQPRNQGNFNFNTPGPFGAYADQNIPGYVNDQTSQYNFPMLPEEAVNPYQYEMTQNGVDPNQVSYDTDMQNRLRELDGQKQNRQVNNNQIADFAMAGVQTLNNFFDKAQNYKQQQFLNQQQAISNTSPAFYGNQGNYDVNQGKLKPNQTTPSYKKGGQYSLNQKDLNALIKAGYDIEFLD